MACKDIGWRGSWTSRVSAAVLDLNMSSWRLKLYYDLGLPKLHPNAEAVIIEYERKIAAKKQTRQTATEQRKIHARRSDRRHYISTDEKANPQYKGISKKRSKRTSDWTHRRLSDRLDSLCEEEDLASDSDFVFSSDSETEEDANQSDDLEDDDEEEPVPERQFQVNDLLEEQFPGSLDREPEESDSEDTPEVIELQNRIQNLWEATERFQEEDGYYILPDRPTFELVDLSGFQ